MALSKPQLGIQSPIQCQLCEQDPKISWKCLECDLLMCSACKNNIHPKIKTAGEHRIVAIKDIKKISSPSRDIGSTSPSSKDTANVDITLVEEFQTKLDGVYHLAISLDDTLWIGDGDRKKGIRLFSSHTGLRKVKCEGNKLKVISSFNIDVFALAITPGNDLLIANNEPILKQIKSGTNKVVETVFNVDPYQAWSIYVTSKNKVIVGGIIQEEDKVKGIVIVMDHKGNHGKVYGEDQTKSISFTYPWKITSTNNDNILVIDSFSDGNEGKVVVIGHEDIINTYCGSPAINTEDTPFTPTNLTTTPADNVIVVDTDNFALHILNSSGNLITYISTKDKGIAELPFSIGYTMAGQFRILYIGTFAAAGDKGKLYKLNMVGC
ncbi:Hypothetical predicted protein [Mytilus galloprovincialis]|uniref:B box-type domain-containing protein n=1 Tax=Mytilus galloprovincialis TaxID=29158 RepID=A0A8B6EI25_MYTGA|nr:Hypothetical predicted protein [Mytilus galloprovincialis]